MDENGNNAKLTTTFSDGDVVTEYFRSQRAANRAKQWWYRVQKLDAEHGNDIYEITGSVVEAL